MKKLFKKPEGKIKSSELPPPVQDKKSHAFFRLVSCLVFLSILVEASLILYPNLISQKSSAAVKTLPRSEAKETPAVIPAVSQQEPKQINEEQIISEPVVQPEGLEDEDNLPDIEATLKRVEILPQQETPPQETNPETAESAEPVRPSVLSKHLPTPSLPVDSYSLAQALAFKEAVLSKKNCRHHVEKLLQIEQPTPQMEKVIFAFLPYCLNQTAHDDMSIFLAHKKQAILQIFRKKHPPLVAYIYALPWLAMDIRKIQPTTDQPEDVLDRLHNAILADDPASALAELDKLPPVISSIFNDLRQKLLQQQQRIAVLDELILSFTGKGE